MVEQSLKGMSASYLGVLYSVSVILNSTLDLKKTLKYLTDVVKDLVNTERCVIDLKEKCCGVKRETYNFSNDFITDLSETILNRVYKTGQTLKLIDAQNHSEFKDRKSVKRLGIRSVLAVPIKWKDEVLGVIYIDNRRIVNAFTEREQALLEAIANVASVAIRNSQKYSTLNQSLSDIKTILNKGFFYTDRFLVVSDKMKRVVEEIERIKDKDEINVLILGETGVGKEEVARAIHLKSRRRNKIFNPVNCPNLKEELFESIMFGHKRGSYTGAIKDHKGKILEADGGTVFLDEIGDLSLSLQAKFLKVLETGEIEEIGASRPRKVDVRFISATNKDIEDMVEKGEFREDLYYRLAGYIIEIPPLRERKEEIIPLANYFLNLYSHDRNIKGFTSRAKEKLINYDYPGNVRELRDVIKRAIVLSENDFITENDIVFGRRRLRSKKNYFDENISLKELEKVHILHVLEKTNWSIVKAAGILGITRQTLRNKIKEYGLEKFKR